MGRWVRGCGGGEDLGVAEGGAGFGEEVLHGEVMSLDMRLRVMVERVCEQGCCWF